MKGLAQTVFAALTMAVAMVGSAQADMVDDVIRLYNPKLVSVRAVIECLAGGGNAVSCANTELTEGELSSDPDIHNIVELIEAVNNNDYPTVVARAGFGIACAWIDFEGKALICNDFAGEAVAIGAAAAGEAAALGEDVAEAFADLGVSIACVGGVLCSDDEDEYDPSVEWERCFTGRIREGVIARLSAGTAWGDLKHNTPNPRTISINGHNQTIFLFREGSIAGDCFNSRLVTAAGIMSFGSGSGQQLAQQHRQAFMAMFARYEELVEQNAVAFLDEAQSVHHNVQQTWSLAGQTNAAEIFGAVAGINAPLIQSAAVMLRRNACVSALNRPPAAMLAAWADSGQHVGSSQHAGPFNWQNWPANAPQTWCAQTFVPALQAALQARQTAYAQARTQGCAQVARNRLRLACPVGSAMARCQEALAGVNNAECTLSGLGVAPPPVTGQVAPQVTQPPQTAPPSPPPLTPVRRPLPDISPATSPPTERSPE